MAYDNETALDLYVTGLRNAHALETEALSIMQRQIDRLENYPDVLQRLEQHRRETEQQVRRLEDLMAGFDESRSTVKDAAASLMGTLAALGHSMAGDEILKNTFANNAFENYEIAAYKSLIALADATGNTEHTKLLEQTLDEEIAMASWLDENVEAVTLRYLQLAWPESRPRFNPRAMLVGG
jgi:ferritin-like metal-binding protein YciE